MIYTFFFKIDIDWLLGNPLVIQFDYELRILVINSIFNS